MRVTVSSDAKRLAVHLGSAAKEMSGVVTGVMQKELEPGKEKARGILMQMIYSKPENPEFPRSNNLWLSTDTTYEKSDGLPAYYVHNNPALATNEYQWSSKSWTKDLGSYSGPESYYPIYVSKGNFFGRSVPGTDFYSQWMAEIGLPLGGKIISEIMKSFKS